MRTTFLLSIFLFFTVTAFSQTTISLSPQMDRVIPDKDLVDVTIQFPGTGPYEIIVQTPKTNPFITTDFPIVEDTVLYRFTGHTLDGFVRFKTMFPIRGEYVFSTTLNNHTEEHLITIHENPAEYTNLMIFLAVLFAAGLLGGVLFQKQAKSTPSPMSTTVTTLIPVIFLFSVVFQSNYAFAHLGVDHGGNVGIVHWQQESDGRILDVQFDSAQAMVGEMINFHVQLSNPDALEPKPFSVRVVTFHEEDETVMFDGTFTSTPVSAEKCGLCDLNIGLQLFDGASTKVTFTVQQEGFPPVQLSGVVDVVGVSPPMSVKLKTSAMLGVVVLLGVGTGFFLIPLRQKESLNGI